MKTPFRHLAVLCSTVLMGFAAEVKMIAPAEAARLVAEKRAVLVDVREPAEWAATGVAGPAVLLAKSDFDGDQKQWKEFLAANRDKQIILYCRSGGRSGTVAGALAEKGVDTANAGGFRDWLAAGLPTRAVEPKPDGK
ncbi:MAG: rhodanese-like domain-containing protein [Opitutus sp.]